VAGERLGQKLAAGQTVVGLIQNFNSPWMVEIAAAIGFDFVLIDCEHGPVSLEGVEAMVRAADASGIAPMVRVPANLPHEILRVLDLGAAGVQVPRIESALDAAAAVRAVRYPPQGDRGLAGSVRAAGYGARGPIRAYVEQANRDVLLWAMVETAAGVAAIDQIASVAGVDAIAIGPGDLSASMGFGGDQTAPDVRAAVSYVLGRCAALSKPASLPGASAEQIAACKQAGARIVQVGAAPWLLQAGRALLQARPAP
jgi:4-hydroxy-2-oxoheptanedioate aldolase